MRHKAIKTSLLSISMSVLATVAVTHLDNIPNVYAQESKASYGTYTVQAGDGVYPIAINHGMTMDELKELNGLTSNLIHPGDVLKVRIKDNTNLDNKPVEEVESKVPTDNTIPLTVENERTDQSPVANTKTYTVRRGDWLGKIANMHGITVSQLKSWNNLRSDLIHPGNVLIVAKGKTVNSNPLPEKPLDTKPTTPKPSTSSTSPERKTYTVRRGDWLGKIANMHGITVSQLKLWNNLRSDLIHPGNVLVVAKGEVPKTERPSENKPTHPKPEEKPSTPSEPTTRKTYTVRPGDWLGKIANMHGITVSQLKSWNNLRSDLIHPGNVLVVAKGEVPKTERPSENKPTNPKPEEKPSTPSEPTTRKTYTVRPGDWLGK
ncbi:LysM peptidoglycan-binding domain-containing protein, partial [Facklamia sp. 7083-14-GEN3]|uniref:muramidase family protein n=1 Tax=Facklamia sp. 7083-14-GEN3 TaxID=2973478 RepID=UPI00215C48EE